MLNLENSCRHRKFRYDIVGSTNNLVVDERSFFLEANRPFTNFRHTVALTTSFPNRLVELKRVLAALVAFD